MNETASVLTQNDCAELRDFFAENVQFDAPLAPLTWWQIGGRADALVNAQNTADIARLLEFCRRRHIGWFVLGNGSNILVGDGGMRGVVVRLTGDFRELTMTAAPEAVTISAGGGASLALLTGQAASRGALGIDGLAGIPATVGGAVRMNAGTAREIGEFVTKVEVQTLSRPEPHEVSLQYLYRRSSVAPDAIVARVQLQFPLGEPAAVRAELQDRLVRRKATQPVAQPNAGSCFRNPPGDRAGRLIEAVGAKGWRIGGAEVSVLHANFIINTGDATAEDVACLLAKVRAAVLEEFAIGLELEVHFVGVFTAAQVSEVSPA